MKAVALDTNTAAPPGKQYQTDLLTVVPVNFASRIPAIPHLQTNMHATPSLRRVKAADRAQAQ